MIKTDVIGSSEIGNVYGLLTVVALSRKRNGRTAFTCKCTCGSLLDVIVSSLRNGNTKSCGCYQKEKASVAKSTHKKSNSPEYQTWCNIKRRCYNDKNIDFHNYGGRGIEVCERWLNSFENFYYDMGERPSNEHSIERVRVNGNYEPNNCIWATIDIQSHNRRNNHRIVVDGISYTITQLETKWGIYRGSIYYYLSIGKSDEWIVDNLSTNNRFFFEVNGQKKKLKHWSIYYAVNYLTLRYRVLNKKESVIEAINHIKNTKK